MPGHYRNGYGRPGPITPLAGVNESLLVHRQNMWFLYRVTGVEAVHPSPALIVDTGAVNAAATTRDQSLQTPLELGEFELGQFRMRVLDDVRLTLYQPRQAGRFTVKRAQATVTLASRIADPCGHLSELYVYKDEYPYMDVNNPTDSNLLITRATFWGFRYKVQELSHHQLGKLAEIPGPYAAVIGEALVRGGGEG